MNNHWIKTKYSFSKKLNWQLPWLKAYEFCNSYRKNLISIQSTKDQQVVTQFLMPLILNGESRIDLPLCQRIILSIVSQFTLDNSTQIRWRRTLECGRLAHPSPDWKLISGSPNWVCSFTATGFTASQDPPACRNASALHQCRKARGLPPRASNGCRSFAKTERAVIIPFL